MKIPSREEIKKFVLISGKLKAGKVLSSGDVSAILALEKLAQLYLDGKLCEAMGVEEIKDIINNHVNIAKVIAEAYARGKLYK